MTEDQEERTVPAVQCDGDPGCGGDVRVLLLGTGERMCAHCAADLLASEIAEAAGASDTDKPGGGDPEVEVVEL